MMHKLMYFITGFLKCRIISIDDAPYLERYYAGTWFGKRYFIHRFMASDPDRGLHDHPWRWARSFILAGGYNELVLDDNKVKTIIRRAPEINYFHGDKFHRVLLPEELSGKTWTLFIHGPRDQDWGFLEYTENENGDILESVFTKANTSSERKENEHWWERKDAKTGRQIRKEQ